MKPPPVANRIAKPVTAERIERGLDRLAEIMVNLGKEGVLCLPIYERLEIELAALRMRDDKMAEVHERKMAMVRDRLKRSQNRTAARSS